MANEVDLDVARFTEGLVAAVDKTSVNLVWILGCLVDLDFSTKPIGRDVLKGDLLLVKDVHDCGGSHDQLKFLQEDLSGLHKHI